MGLETTNFISGLQSSNPLSTDVRSQGDDHLRLIKKVLKQQFPGADGSGFAAALTASEVELNYVNGVTSSIQTQLNTVMALAIAKEIPTGTVMCFYQAAAPVGWTKVTTHTNSMLRVVSGTGGGAGGIDSPIVMDTAPPHNHTVTTGVESANHTHTFTTSANGQHAHSYYHAINVGTYAAGTFPVRAGEEWISTNFEVNHTHTGTTAVDTGSHTHSGTTAVNTGSGGADATAWRPLYIDIILCSKNASMEFSG